MSVYDPEDWLQSTVRCLKSYVTDFLNAPNVWDVRMAFPGAASVAELLPMKKSIIHFEIDAIEEREIGFGDTPTIWGYDNVGQVFPQWARLHLINFDVGIWASDMSGGTTSRMRARQHLTRLFSLPEGAVRLRAYSDNGDGPVDIISFTGGRFTLDSVNDIRLYRMVDSTLTVRVYSRTPVNDVVPGPAIEEIVQAPNLTILG